MGWKSPIDNLTQEFEISFFVIPYESFDMRAQRCGLLLCCLWNVPLHGITHGIAKILEDNGIFALALDLVHKGVRCADRRAHIRQWDMEYGATNARGDCGLFVCEYLSKRLSYFRDNVLSFVPIRIHDQQGKLIPAKACNDVRAAN